MKKIFLTSILSVIIFCNLFGQVFIEQNQPEVDSKTLHFGFSVGLNTQNTLFTHINQSASPEQFYAESPSYSPGFSVGLVSDLYLTRYLNLRFVPGLHFGSKEVSIKNLTTGELLKQDLKSNYLLLPLELKYSSLRFNNSRPYLMIGAALGYDLSLKTGDTEYLRLKPFDLYLEVGVGCDLYFQYYKLIPELKVCFGMSNVLDTKRTDLEVPLVGANPKRFTQALSKASSRLIVLSFYFE